MMVLQTTIPARFPVKVNSQAYVHARLAGLLQDAVQHLGLVPRPLSSMTPGAQATVQE